MSERETYSSSLIDKKSTDAHERECVHRGWTFFCSSLAQWSVYVYMRIQLLGARSCLSVKHLALLRKGRSGFLGKLNCLCPNRSFAATDRVHSKCGIPESGHLREPEPCHSSSRVPSSCLVSRQRNFSSPVPVKDSSIPAVDMPRYDLKPSEMGLREEVSRRQVPQVHSYWWQDEDGYKSSQAPLAVLLPKPDTLVLSPRLLRRYRGWRES